MFLLDLVQRSFNAQLVTSSPQLYFLECRLQLGISINYSSIFLSLESLRGSSAVRTSLMRLQKEMKAGKKTAVQILDELMKKVSIPQSIPPASLPNSNTHIC